MLVVLAADDNYAKYAAVAIRSVICNHKMGGQPIRFYVLHRDISHMHQRMLESMSDERHTVSCLDVTGRLDSKILYVSGTITEETYYRVLVPELFPEDDQALYIDCDLVCQEDIEDFWQVATLSDKEWIAGTLAANLEEKNRYTTEHLGIPCDTYVNAGVLMMNLKVMREINFLAQSIVFLKEKQPLEQHDQDLINALCYGHIKVLDRHWHATVGTIERIVHKPTAVLALSDLNYCFLHYATNKPFKREMMTAMLPYWRYVGETPFAEEIVEAYREISDTKRHFKDMCSNNQISLGYLWECFIAGMEARLHRR